MKKKAAFPRSCGGLPVNATEEAFPGWLKAVIQAVPSAACPSQSSGFIPFNPLTLLV
jgi:hypothetical protein